jgi:hypothetical protein
MDKFNKPPEMFVRANLPLPGFDKPLADVKETVCLSSLSLLKLVNYGRAGLSLEVMVLMVRSVVDVCLFICFDYLMSLCGLSTFNRL